MKKMYENPIFLICEISREDVISTSLQFAQEGSGDIYDLSDIFS